MKETLATVNMTYARIALILLAANLLLTGYTISKISSADDAVEQQQAQPTQQANNAGGSPE